jgi:hypothetical protein
MSHTAENDAGWEWKRPPGHESQPLIEWWVEQVAVVIVATVGQRARRRGDRQTFARMLAVSCAGRDAETRPIPPGQDRP